MAKDRMGSLMTIDLTQRMTHVEVPGLLATGARSDDLQALLRLTPQVN